MPTNAMVFNQASTILNAINAQATGAASIGMVNTSDFVSVANTVLRTGYDAVFNAINQVLSRTIISTRPYNRKFNGVEADATRYGNHIRKISFADNQLENSSPFAWPAAYDSTQTPPSGNGHSVDQQVIKKAQPLQTNFYGVNVYQDHYTIFRKQLETAFTGPEELVAFTAGITQNMRDRFEQARENLARAVVANFMGGIIDEGAADRVVHLLTEYNAATGLSLTATTVYQPANFPGFVKWVYGRIAALCALMTERSEMFQTVVNSLHVNRHTPYANQKVYLYAPARYHIEASVLADIYHDNYLRMADTETVNFWQSIETPDTINVTPARIGATGAVVTAAAPVVQGNIFGVIFDQEALGYSVLDSRITPAPYNAAGEYSNFWMHEEEKCWNDHTEKGIVLLLD